jgi:hypothetical protein
MAVSSAAGQGSTALSSAVEVVAVAPAQMLAAEERPQRPVFRSAAKR